MFFCNHQSLKARQTQRKKQMFLVMIEISQPTNERKKYKNQFWEPKIHKPESVFEKWFVLKTPPKLEESFTKNLSEISFVFCLKLEILNFLLP